MQLMQIQSAALLFHLHFEHSTFVLLYNDLTSTATSELLFFKYFLSFYRRSDVCIVRHVGHVL